MRTLKLVKRSQRHLDTSVMRTQLRYIVSRSIAGNRGKVWTAKPVPVPLYDEANEEYIYSVSIKYERTGRSIPKAKEDRQWTVIQEMAEKAGRSKGWTLAGSPVPVAKQQLKDANGTEDDKSPVLPVVRSYSSFDVNVHNGTGEHFSHLYDRENQIAMVKSAIEAFADNRDNRFNVVMYGEPASGKTEVLRSFARWLGPQSCLVFDATSTTKAGAERILLETKEIPPILIIEEIEKTDEASLRWLLGLTDQRGEVRKVTHRTVSNRSVQLLCLATVNDMTLFEKAMDGALASRFSHRVFCPRPNRDVLRMILKREVKTNNGNPAWIEPALDWCMDEEKTTDPRRVIAVCLSGKDKLLSGEYQKCLRATMKP